MAQFVLTCVIMFSKLLTKPQKFCTIKAAANTKTSFLVQRQNVKSEFHTCRDAKLQIIKPEVKFFLLFFASGHTE